MKESHLNILMKEYELVNQQWMLATRHKAVVVQVVASAIVALAGASFLGHFSCAHFSLAAPVLVSVATFIYTQKEADYWAAAMYETKS